MHSVDLPQGTVRYRDDGEGRPLVFVHGILVNGLLWRRVAPKLDGFRMIVPDWPLGGHPVPLNPGADLSPPGLARLVADFLDALGLDDVVLVGNDTGGAICQIVAANHPERIGALVLTSCDAFDNFLPPMFRGLQLAARVPGGVPAFIAPLRIRAARNLPLAFGWLRKRPIEREVSDAYLEPYFQHAGVRRDLRKVLAAISTRHTQDAAAKLPGFEKPALIAWSADDRFFPLDHARRLAALLPQSRLETIADSYSFSPEDQPGRVAELLREFLQTSSGSSPSEAIASNAASART
ncbi:MAG TPA: alpha/beta hydrolase [Solirubrobacteraceae bacterium]|jgi:pimeloyl-ACP methyl ester carboxylesterase